MSVSLTQDKRGRIASLTSQLLKNENLNIREVASLIGLLVSCFRGIQFGPLYYRYLDICKNKALRLAKGNLDSPIHLSVSAISELDWWAKNILSVSRPINTPDVDLLIYSDASLESWGRTDDIETVGGRWSENEMQGHITVLELHAAKLCLWALAKAKSNIHVRLLLDHTTRPSKSHAFCVRHTQFDAFSHTRMEGKFSRIL